MWVMRIMTMSKQTYEILVFKYFGKIASPYMMSYLYNRTSLDIDFGIRKDDAGDFRIGKSLIEIDENSYVYVDGKTYTGTPGLYELITRKKVNKSLITTRDLKNYRRILEASSANKKHNNTKGPIKTTRGVKFRGHFPLIPCHE